MLAADSESTNLQVCFDEKKGGVVVSKVLVEPAILASSNLYVRGSTVCFAVILLLLTIAGDIELNPGPVRFPCGTCGRAVQTNQRGVCCDECNKWYHARCANIADDDYMGLSSSTETWVCINCHRREYVIQTQQMPANVDNEREHVRFPCGTCGRAVQTNHRGVCCDECNKWYHATCANIANSDYLRLSSSSERWVCSIICHNRQEQQIQHQQRHLLQEMTESEREHVRFPCGTCGRAVRTNHRGVCCDECNKWYHARCANIANSDYLRLSSSSERWVCNDCHRQLPEHTTHQHEHRASQCASHNNMTQKQYLYSGGWQTEFLHEQSWAKYHMNQFQSKQDQWQNKKCIICNEQWPTRTCLNMDPYVCNRCQRDKHNPKLFSPENDMDPGSVPPCLKDMTQIEELLIARACPIMTVYHKHGGQLGYSGHVLNLPQNIQQFINKLPVRVNDLPVLTISRQGAANTHHNFRVRREKVLSALQWLKHNNKFYSDIDIDLDSVQHLPVDGIPDDLLNFKLSDSDNEPVANEGPPTEDTEDNVGNIPSSSYVPHVQQVQTEEDAIRSTVAGNDPLEWPPIENTPINEFQTEGLATMVFPTLFPYGKGDPTCKGRRHAVTLAEAFKHLERYCDVLSNGLFQWRFASHPRFPYWALNMKQRHELLSRSTLYIRQHPCDASLTVEQLQDMVGTMNSIQVMNRLQRYATNVLGSKQYWYTRYQELKALLEQKGPATFFWTVSSADNYWPELHSLLPHNTQIDVTHGMRVNAVIKNPHITDWFFHSKLKDFVNYWLLKTLDAEWYWFRYEYQARGSTHAHGCAKLKNDPGLCELVKIAALGWMEEKSNESNKTEANHNQHIILYGQHAKQRAIAYADWLVTTINDSIPDGYWTLPQPHPCTIRLTNVADIELNEDYSNLVNTVQRHTRCSPAYCLKQKQNQQEPACRFGYPKESTTQTEITFEHLTNGDLRATLTTKRNDPRVNSHNRLMLQNWRANVDLQVIVDMTACARYMAKYVSKCEPHSKAMDAIYADCVSKLGLNSNPLSAFRKAMIQVVGERDFGAQETAHILQSLPLYSCTFNFVTLSLDGGRKIRTNTQSPQEKSTTPSILETYMNRIQNQESFPNIMSLNIVDFVSKYTISQNELVCRTHEVIVRTFPIYSSDPRGNNYGLYCKYQLLKYKPWQTNPQNAWDNQPECDASFISMYMQFLSTDYAKQHVATLAEELHRAEQYESTQSTNDDETDQTEDTPEHNQEEWMFLCQLQPTYTTPESPDDNVDWEEAARQLPQSLLLSCPNWIKSMRSQSDYSSSRRQLTHVDTSSLNQQQMNAYQILSTHYTSNDQHPLHMLILGTAGTGKSFLIQAIAQLLQDKCLLTATTGIAAFHIGGITLHSALHLPVQKHNSNDLRGQALAMLQHKMKDVRYLIVDEVSMLGQNMMAWVDKRLRQATTHLDVPFGGLSVVLIGDFAQLPPVGDRPLFAPEREGSHGYTMYRLFTKVVILDQVVRQSGTSMESKQFRDLLLRLRDGLSTESDWTTLLQRTPTNATNAGEFHNAIRLFYTKENVAIYNHEAIANLGSPIAKINAIHSCTAAAATTTDDAGGLEPVVFMATGAKVMLTSNLWQQVGLCNGTAGIIDSLLYAEGQKPPNLPIAVLVNFPDYAGPPFLINKPKCVPIPPVVFEWHNGSTTLSRQQLPLRLSYAMTIHKSQGQTMAKAVIDIGSREMSAGCTFVALSRLKTLSGLLIQPMSFERLKSIGKLKRMHQRISEEQRLKQLNQ